MSWRNPFLLGRPGQEVGFELNPAAMKFDPRCLADVRRAVDGTLTKVVLSRNRPLTTLNGNYITPAFLNQLMALSMIDDTMLVFEPQADFSLDQAVRAVASGQCYEIWQERVVPDSTTQLTLPANSWTKADQLRAAAGGVPTIRIISLADSYRAGRLGATERYDTNGTHSYGQTFEALALGDLNTQVDNAIAWAKIVGGGGDKIEVSNAAPIDGSQDLVITGVPIYRRTFGFTLGSFRMTYDFLQGAEASLAFGSGADISAFTGAPLWIRVFGGFVQIKCAGTSTQTLAYTSTGTKHTIAIEFFNGVVAISLDGVFLARARCTTFSFDRLFLGASSGLGGGHLDAFAEQNTSGSFSHADSTITLETALADLTPRFVTYQTTAYGCTIQGLPASTQGGMVDHWRYDVDLEGA